MVKLTIDFVKSKSKANDLNSIKKLNCWACDLTDISELKYLTQVEILTLSVNKIKTLESLKYCTNLKELYIRDNQISDINQLFYLKNLQQLRILWLADNPCALDNNYRLITLKVLPNLHKLDNAVVTQTEIENALNLSLELTCPYEEKEINEHENDLEDINEISSKLNSILTDADRCSTDDEDTLSASGKVLNGKNVDDCIRTIENDSTKYEVDFEESNKLRRELGLKELKAPSLTDLHSKSTSNSTQIQTISNNSVNVISAITALIQDLNEEGLETVIKLCHHRKEAFKTFLENDS